MSPSLLRRAYLPVLLGCLVTLLLIQLGSRRETHPAPVAALPSKSALDQERAKSGLAALEGFDRWLADYRSTPATRRPTMIEEARSLATLRREAFLELMVRDPDLALERALSLREYAALPPDLVPLFERPISGVGSIDLTWETSRRKNGSLSCIHLNTLYLGDETWTLSRPISSGPLPPRQDVPVSGIALGGLAVLAPSAVRPLGPDDLVAAANLFPAGDPEHRDPITGQPGSSRAAALVGGKIHQFESRSLAEHVATTLVTAEEDAREANRYVIEHGFEWLAANDGGKDGKGRDSASPAVLKTPFMDDTIDVLFIRVDFSDFPGAPVTKSALESTLASVRGYIEEFSYNQATIVSTVSSSVYRMPSNGTTYAVNGDNAGIQTDARALANGDYTLAAYDVIAVFFPNLSGVSGTQISYGGRATIGGASHWINGINNVDTILHEFGHNYGLNHSNYRDPGQAIGGRYDVADSLEYGDIFDTMGSGDVPKAHFNHFSKNLLDWLPDSKVTEATESATFRIYRFDDAAALSNPLLAVKVPMGGAVNYWIGYRQLYPDAAFNLAEAAYLVAEGLSQTSETNLVDCTPGSATPETEDRKDCGLEIGTPFVEGGVTFTAIQRGGSSPNEWIDVGVSFTPRVGLAKTALEVGEDSGTAWVTFRRRFGTAGAVSIDFATSDGTASSGSDYYPASGTVTWADGDGADKTVAIAIRPDALAEGSEDLDVTLSNPTGALLDPSATTGVVSILDPGQRCNAFDPEFFNYAVNAIAIQDDGMILIGGNIHSTMGEFLSIFNLARLHPDGSVDTTLLTGSGFDATVEAIAIQDDGKILVGGAFTSYNGTPCNRLVRLNSEGAIETSFVTNLGTGADAVINALAVQPDGKILVGGDFTTFNSTPAAGLVRLNSDGTADTPLALPFNAGFAPRIDALVAQDDGKIMVGGTFYIGWTGSGFRSGIARLNADGSRDPNFDPDAGAHAFGSTSNVRGVHSISPLPDGSYLIGGRFTAYDETPRAYLARINSNGSVDPLFVPPAFNDSVYAVQTQANGKILVGGRFSSPTNGLVRLEADGSVDPSFNVGTGTFDGGGADPVYTLTSSSTGAVFAGGNFFDWNGANSRPVIKLWGGVSPYSLWAAANFTPAQIAAGDAEPGANPDGDLLTNAAERALGTPPLTLNNDPIFGAGGAGTVSLHPAHGMEYLQVTVDKVGTGSGAWFAAQFTNDYSSWTPSPAVPGNNAVYDILEDSQTRFVIRDKAPFNGRRFVKIGILNPE